MGLPDGRKSFKIGLIVLIQYRRVTDSQPPTHPASQVAVASTRYAYLRRAVKMTSRVLKRTDFYAVAFVFVLTLTKHSRVAQTCLLCIGS